VNVLLLVIGAMSGLLLAVLLLWFSFFSLKIFSKDLKNVDLKLYEIAVSLNKNPLFTKGRVKFFVLPDVLMFKSMFKDIRAATTPYYSNIIFLHHTTLNLNQDFFETIIAHELGHIESAHSTIYEIFTAWPRNRMIKELEAHRFALKIVGKAKLRKALVSDNLYEFIEPLGL
jgi:Zn-dependent protease with chaperone function